jgi:hypothetical protein
MRFFKDIKNVKKNWNTIQQSPYASLHFRYRTTMITITLFSLFIAWTIFKIVTSQGQAGWMGIVTKCFTVGIGILIITKAYGTLTPLKKAMEPYKKKKELINHSESDAKVEIADILDQFDDSGKRKNIHQGKKELNSNKQKK